MKSERLKTSAKNNTVRDFEFSYFDDIDDALIVILSFVNYSPQTIAIRGYFCYTIQE